ncbi:methylamine utilization protein [Paraglaciecola aquimarina]|uniref:Methylamine utilization protein n=1 Tax=Paraglaciecola aquimarina TaxID=1235557 RepID=A0ABU3T0P6_9ALTE|nr:methylamine utilization protein [Paraglaciecola aquimarina]MDU0355828.1 methylamine utilization protein [Paraglaciecola aquimarina]
MYRILCVFVLLFSGSNSFSKEIMVNVSALNGASVSNVVVYLQPSVKQQSTPPSDVAIMDQIDTQFSPHILAIQKNALVKFPNSDSIKHHVYSFSAAKTFELQLYKDLQADPLLFSKEGVVELGCNVHDWMLGYIFIVDSPYFAKSDKNGNVRIDVPLGDYTLKVWSPLIQDDLDTLSTQLKVSDNTKMQKITLKKALLPNLIEYESSDEFQDYD